MPYTLSWHNQGSRANQAHNRRDPKSVSKSSNIDTSKSKNNIVIFDQDVKDAYKELFQAAVDEFNARQTHADRIIKDYYDKINKDSKKHLVYEFIVQIGSKAEGCPINSIDALIDYVYDFQKRNPNMYIVGAYIHQDEEGAIHLHLDYIPFAECSRGMKLQTTLTGALKAQGFVTNNSRDTAQMQWEQSERDAMREICSNLGIDLYEQGIGRKRHLETPEYKELRDQLNAIIDQIKALNSQIDVLEGKRQSAKNGLHTDIQKWTDFRQSTLDVLEYLQAFHTAVETYEPEFAQYVDEFLRDYTQNPDEWPAEMVLDDPDELQASEFDDELEI